MTGGKGKTFSDYCLNLEYRQNVGAGLLANAVYQIHSQ